MCELFEKKLERIGLNNNKNLVWITFLKKECVLERASRMFIEMYELFEGFERMFFFFKKQGVLEYVWMGCSQKCSNCSEGPRKNWRELIWIIRTSFGLITFFKKGCVLECASRIFIEMQELFERKLEKIGVKIFFFKKGSVLERTNRMFIEIYELFEGFERNLERIGIRNSFGLF